jgi:hypothetical protein
MLTFGFFVAVVLGLLLLECAESRLGDWLDRRRDRQQLEREEGSRCCSAAGHLDGRREKKMPEGRKGKDIVAAIGMPAEHSEASLTLPAEPYRLEEVNLSPTLAASLAGQTVTVRILPEEEVFTRRVNPNAESSAWLDPEGNYWNDYQPLRILFTDPNLVGSSRR